MKLVELVVERFGTLEHVALPLGATSPSADPPAPLPARQARGKTATRKRSPPAVPGGHAAGARSSGDNVVVVLGENEAGKTTLLRAIRYLLLGDERPVDKKRGEEPRVRATVELASGTRIAIERRRGKPAFVGRVVGVGDDAPEDWFLAALGNPDASVFRNVFAFSLDELASGARLFEKKEVNLGSLLFGSGLGGTVRPAAVLDDLEKEMGGLFLAGGRVQAIPNRLARIDELRLAVRSATTAADELDRLDAAIADDELALTTLHDALAELAKTRTRVTTLLSCLEPYGLLRAARAERAGLGAVPPLAPTSRAEVEAARTARELGLRELARLKERLPLVEAELARLATDDAVLDAADAIDALAKGVAEAENAATRRRHRDLALRELESKSVARLTDLLAVGAAANAATLLYEPLPDELRERALAAAERVRAAEATARDRSVVFHTTLERRRVVEAERAALPPQDDTAALQIWLDEATTSLPQQERLEAMDADLRRLRREEERELARLDPPPPPGDAALVAMPRTEEIDAFDRRMTEEEETRRRLEQELARVDLERANCRAQLAEIHADFEVPTEGDLTSARAHRDAGWALAARALAGDRDVAGERSYDEERDLSLAYERAVLEADLIVDRMRFHADAVQRRAQKNATLAHLDQETERLEAELRRHARLEGETRTAWVQLFAAAGVAPRGPSAMRAWLVDRERYLSVSEQRRATEEARTVLARRLDGVIARGRSLLGRGAPLSTLRGEAEQRVTRERRRSAESDRIEAEWRRLERALVEESTRARQADEELEAARSELASALAALHLDPSCNAARAPAVVAELARLRAEVVTARAEAEARGTDDDAALAAIERRVQPLCSLFRGTRPEASAAPRGDDALLVARTLVERLAAAREGARLRTSHELQRDALRLELARHERAVDDANARLAAVARAAGVDEPALAAALDRAERARELDRHADDATRELARGRGPFELPELLATLDERIQRGRDALAAELAPLDTERARLAEDEERIRTELAKLRHDRARLDGGSAAAEAALDLSAERAALRADVERFAVLALGKALLEQRIAAFERDNQPALVAEASRLFATMTAGRYPRVVATGRRELFVERASGGRLAPSDLSTGTSEQLFFALRLAYVSLYSARAEPLPVVLDDVLVNFDAQRASATLAALGAFSERVQVLFFTCHAHLAALAARVLPSARQVTLGSARGDD